MSYRLPLLLFLLISCPWAYSQELGLEWKADPVDGHRTGVVYAPASESSGSIGFFKGRTYVSPSGRHFRKGTVPRVARLMLESQDRISEIRQVVAYSEKAMTRNSYECALYDWYVDELMRAVQDSVGRRVHLGIANRRGVRGDIPEGPVMYSDLMTVFPFNNHICYLALKGSEIRSILGRMASTEFQIVGGAKITAIDGGIVSVEIDGEPLADDKVYGVATIDYLLDGGDGYRLAENALETIVCEGVLYDTMLSWVKMTADSGRKLSFSNQHWITIR